MIQLDTYGKILLMNTKFILNKKIIKRNIIKLWEDFINDDKYKKYFIPF